MVVELEDGRSATIVSLGGGGTYNLALHQPRGGDVRPSSAGGAATGDGIGAPPRPGARIGLGHSHRMSAGTFAATPQAGNIGAAAAAAAAASGATVLMHVPRERMRVQLRDGDRVRVDKVRRTGPATRQRSRPL